MEIRKYDGQTKKSDTFVRSCLILEPKLGRDVNFFSFFLSTNIHLFLPKAAFHIANINYIQ